MANFTIFVNGGSKVRFNVKAQSGTQAINKAYGLLADYPTLLAPKRPDIQLMAYSSSHYIFQPSLPFISITRTLQGRYKVNPNTNKKVIATLLKLL